MAGIDKTYVTNWEDYKAAYDWVSQVGRVKDDFGNIFYPLDWMAEYTEFEFRECIESQKKRYREYYADPIHVQEAKDVLGQDWEPNPEGAGELVLWNTPTYFDIWLIRNCPIDFIQDRLKQQYASDYDEIKERRSVYDNYVKPAAGSHFKIALSGLGGKVEASFPRVRAKWYHFQVLNSSDWYYSDETKEWHHWLECREWNTNTADIRGCLTKRKLKRIILKWGFPAGTILRVYSSHGHLFQILVKR